ncbi:hypothetical protein KC340_g11982 [Hortaea werneckii]|nr:hypothetical protein KC342_g12293 [Hortaea werneckii]KAI7095200.1 hypothetical protein KC339_g11145 [Hortaea werneckii]KAI7221315.1 hypothetical protein KC365_g11737 [Hortaea werneckii]KAI7305467.1 hypothetical protein KC340_g11982 [Hortaea werneckii]KAI7391986.1 hypothetical protein KC328_g7251 [Hortaea werneckii]
MARLCFLAALALAYLCLSAASAKVVAADDTQTTVVTRDEYPTAISLDDMFPQAEGSGQNDYQAPTTLMALPRATGEPILQQTPGGSISITPVARGASFSTTVMGTHPTCMSNGIAFDCGPTPTHPSPDNLFPTATIYRPNPADTSRFRDLSCQSSKSSLGVAKKVIEAEIQKVCSKLGRIWDPRTDGDGNTITHDGVLPGGKKYQLFAMFTQPGNTAVDFSTPVCKAGFLMPFENCKANKDGLFRGGWVTLGLGKGGRESDILFKVRADWPPKVERRSVDQAETLQVAKEMKLENSSTAVQDLPEDAVCNATLPASMSTSGS